MQFEVLGGVQVLRGGEPIELGGPLPRRLLAALLLGGPRSVSSETLIHRLWGDEPPATARTALQVHVSRLRQVLEPDRGDGERWRVLSTVTSGYALDVDRRHFDAARYVDLVGEADHLAAQDVHASLRRLESAHDLWKGRPWGDLAEAPWLEADATRLDELRRHADELRAELELALGRHDLLLDRLRAAVAEEPLRERRWEQLMVALYRSGRQANAPRAFQEARRVFVEELGIEPGRSLRELERAVLSQDPDLDAPARAPLLEGPYHNLPSPLTALLGRFDDVQSVQKLLATSRLVTITGTGGCGKTRLALAVAEEVCEQQADGAWFADLTPARTGELVAVHLASELGLREADEHGGAGPLDLVRAFLRRKELVLVLDNCEQIAAEVAGIAGSLLAACPDVKIIVTSRVALGVVGETCYSLAPLETPPVDAAHEELAASPAVRLFVERAEDVGSRDSRGAEQLEVIAALCRFLEGLPLAIEMAAMSTRTLSPAELLERLDRRLSLADLDDELPARHRALRATIDWSHALLTEPEQRALRRISVFAAGCTLPGAEAVVADASTSGDAVVGLVNRLVGASLLRPDDRTTPRRYQMLEAIREYADEQLVATDETEMTRRLQLDYLVELGMAVRIEERLGPPPRRTMSLLDAEHDNIRAVLQQLIEHGDADGAARLAGAMGTYWNERGHWGEGKRWLVSALALSSEHRTLDRARALVALAESTSSFAGIAAARAELEEAVDICREHGAEELLAVALVYLSNAHGWNNDRGSMRETFSEATTIAATISSPWIDANLAVYQNLGRVIDGEFALAHDGLVEGASVLVGLGDGASASRALMYAGNVARIMGDLPAARRDLERSIELASADVLHGTRTHSALTLAQVAMELGDPDAPSRFRECIVDLERIGDDRCLATCERVLGSRALDEGRPGEALRLLQSSLDALALHDERSLALALADIARIRAGRGDGDAATQLVGAARILAERSGVPLSGGERERLAAAECACSEHADVVDLDAALDIARQP